MSAQRDQSFFATFGSVTRDHLMFFVLLFVVLLLRIPNLFEPYWYGDEGIYLTVGQAMHRGSLLYAEIIDHKTPIIYWIAAWTRTLFLFKLVLVISSVVSLTLFYRLARLFLPKAGAYLSTFVFGVLLTLPVFEGNIANGEILLMPFVLGGVLVFWASFPKRIDESKVLKRYFRNTSFVQPLMVGVLFSLALLLKVPSGFDFAALGLFLVLMVPFVWRRTTILFMLRYGVLVLVGFFLPIVLSILYFESRGTLESYYDFGLLYNFRYISSWSSPFSHPVAVFLSTLWGRLLLLGSFIAILFGFRKHISLPLRFTLVWFSLSFFASLLSLRPYPHYFIQVLPAFSLLVGFLLSTSYLLRLVILLLLFFGWFVLIQLRFETYPTLHYYTNFLSYSLGNKGVEDYRAWFDPKTTQTYRVASWIQEHTTPEEQVFIWGDEPMVYALSNRSPVGRFTVAFHIESFVGAREETLDALSAHPPVYILDFLHQRDRFPKFYDLLSREYRLVEVVDSAHIYQKN